MDEVWKPVVGWEIYYEVSSTGNVRSKDRPARVGVRGWRGRVLKPQLKKRGYYSVTLYADGVSAQRKIHVLVAEAFHGSAPEGTEVRHIDGNPLNNRSDNLAHGTKSENRLDAVRHGTHYQTAKTHCPSGHAYDEKNTRLYQGRRYCRRCDGWLGED